MFLCDMDIFAIRAQIIIYKPWYWIDTLLTGELAACLRILSSDWGAGSLFTYITF